MNVKIYLFFSILIYTYIGICTIYAQNTYQIILEKVMKYLLFLTHPFFVIINIYYTDFEIK